jgi:N-acetyl-alpha-D-muramate 1-phosphate uridylyltransferase
MYKAMILAAGLGNRMRPLTDNTPKPLLEVGGKPLLQYHLEALADAGIQEVVINLAYLGHKIRAFAGDGARFGLGITYSEEPEPLETAGAIAHAHNLLGDTPFLLINGDVWTNYPLSKLCQHQLGNQEDAHLILVPNPSFHPDGDFSPDAQGRLCHDPNREKFTFAGLSLINPRLIHNYPHKRTKFPLGEVLKDGIAKSRITAECFTGEWSDVGTPARLHHLAEYLAATRKKDYE